MASKRARERAEFLVTSNRGVLADIIPAVANALDQAWEDADNRVVAEREARLERDRAADKLMTDRAYRRGMTRGFRDGIEHGAAAERERSAKRLRGPSLQDIGVEKLELRDGHAYVNGEDMGEIKVVANDEADAESAELLTKFLHWQSRTK